MRVQPSKSDQATSTSRASYVSQSIPTGIDCTFATTNEGLWINEADDLRVNVDVAVLDTGVDDEHSDLEVVSQVDCHGGKPPSCVEGQGVDFYGHGTHVAGTIGAIDNGEGDWDDTVGVWRRSNDTWYLRDSNDPEVGGYASLQLGDAGLPALDLPVVGNWDGA